MSRQFGLSFKLVFTLLALSLTLLAVGCTKKSNDLEVELPNGEKLALPTAQTLRINLTTEPPSLDWHKSTDTTSSLVTGNIMEGLVTYDLTDRELGLKPALALTWTPSENARKWRILLRPGVKWTDGVDFTAQQVLDGWKRLLSAETGSQYAYFLYGLKNGRAFAEGKVTNFDEVGVKAAGSHELLVELEKPMSYFPQLLTHHSTYPIRLDIVAKFGEKWTDPTNIVTLGPFQLKVWQHDKMLVLARSDSYYGEKPSFQFIAAYMIIEQAAALNLFDSGKLDALNSLPSTELRSLKKRKEYREIGSLLLYYYGINTQKPPMDNPIVRKAISHAIDRQQIVQLLAGGQIPMTSWVPSGMFGYDASRGVSFDPAKARDLLKQAGYGEKKKLPKLTIKVNTNEDHKRVAENIQSQLKTNLGIEVEILNEEWKVYLAGLNSDPPHLFRFGWLADYPDPDNFMNLMTSFSENNRTRWKNSKYDDLILKAASEINKDERRRLYSEAQKILVEEDVPVIPLYSGVQFLLVSPRVQDYPINALGRFEYKGVHLK